MIPSLFYIEVSGQFHTHVTFSLGKESPFSIRQEAGLNTAVNRKISAPTENRITILWVVQPIYKQYTANVFLASINRHSTEKVSCISETSKLKLVIKKHILLNIFPEQKYCNFYYFN
jgi:hypothetical protein